MAELSHERVEEGRVHAGLGQWSIHVGVHPLPDGRDDELVAGAELAVDVSEGHARRGRHLAQHHRVGAAGLQECDDLGEDALLRRRRWVLLHHWR